MKNKLSLLSRTLPGGAVSRTTALLWPGALFLGQGLAASFGTAAYFVPDL